jgi:glycosyltransferase involved in cell wall biosynthesis
MSLEHSRSSADASGHPADALLLARESERQPTLSIVLPTRNEEAGIAECLTRVKNALAEMGVTGEILVSDSSTDRTPDIAQSMGAHVVTPEEPGYGYAYRYAFARTRGEYVVMGDADTTYDFEAIPRLVDVASDPDVDVALGSRLDGEIRPGAMPWLHQHVGNPLLTRFLNGFYDAGVTDAHSGFRVLTREAVETLDLHADGMEFASEMIMDAATKGLAIEEVPITYHERTGEATLDTFRDGWRHVKFMLVNAPGYLFSVPGALMGLAGLTLMVLGFFELSVSGQPFGIHSLIAGSLATLVGYQVGSFGILSDLAADPIRSPDDPVTRWLQAEFTLERGMAIGFAFLGAGTALAATLVWNWYQSGFEALPLVSADIVAFTLIVVGIQTLFTAFFASILSETDTGARTVEPEA